MNKEQYLKQRNALIKESEELINKGDVKAANEKMAAIKSLDDQFEESAKAQANLNALNGQSNSAAAIPAMDNALPEGFQVVDTANFQAKKTKEQTVLENLSNDESYISAWVKDLQGKQLNKQEYDVFEKVNDGFKNEFTHDTGNSSTLIPTTVAAGIVDMIKETYPFFSEVYSMAVPGKFSMIKHDAIKAGDADWYDEDTETEDEENSYATVDLGGCELSKAVTISWKLKAMAMKDFIPHIQREIATRMGAAKGNAVFTGKGKPGTGDTFKEQPLGVEKALKEQKDTPQIVEYKDSPTYDDIVDVRSKVHSTYANGAKWYAKSTFIWSALAKIKDNEGRPIFIPDPTGQGVGRMFGLPVVEDDGTSTDTLVLGNANRGYIWNTNEPMSLVTEEHAKKRKTDYVAYSIEDGGPLDEAAFGMLVKTAAAAKTTKQ